MINRHFIAEQYHLARHITDVKELRGLYAKRSRDWPVAWDTETTGLHFGVPNVLYDPDKEREISRQLFPVVFGVSMAFVLDEKFVTDGTNGLYLMWCRRGTDLFDTAVKLLADGSDKLFHNSKFDLRVLQAGGIEVGGVVEDTLVMSRIFWDRRRSHGLKKLTEFLAPSLSNWDAPVGKELTRLKGKFTRLIKSGEIEWPYEKVSYANYSFIPEMLMGQYASLDAFICPMLYLRLQGEAQWR